MKKRKKLQLVKVVWNDACDVPGWFSLEEELQEILEEPLPEPLECTSVGFLVRRNKTAIWLTNMYAEDQQGLRGGGIQVIPAGFVKEFSVLEEWT